jgi:diguanylate cyclase (GGDEF)-like protein
MQLRAKVSIFFVAISVALIAVLAAISLYAFRSFSIVSATDHIRTAAEIVRVTLTESMINGVIDKRASFLRRITEVQGLKSARVIRSHHVVEQFGPGFNTESPADEIERRVLQEGKPQFGISELGDDLIFRGTIPYIASSHGTPNCLQCHQVEEGTVLGAVTMTMSIEGLREKALITVAGLIGSVFLFVTLLFKLQRHLVQPIASTASAVEESVREALNGNFKCHVDQHTNDEVGQIAVDMNRLLSFLDEGLRRISSNVALLTERTPKPGENLLTATIDMVDGLTRASHFKQAIEEDEAKVEIYQRLSVALMDEFKIKYFSLYELTGSRKQMTTVMVDGELGAPCRWCDPQIMVRPEACRARRTGHVVNGINNPSICYAFQPDSPDSGQSHLCFPIIQSGSVRAILQLVVPPDEREHVNAALPYINVYLREAAPVLEAKRLMETLRDSTLRDPMTGLSNRRFLEEYIETLVANVQRNRTHLALLMLDLDYFKMVNDTHGHDAGDAVLKELSKVLKNSVRASDMVIRYGGEEFLIILQNAEGDAADRVAENIRAAVEAMKVNVGSITLQKTISIGIADFPNDSDTFWQAVKFADVALYRAKEDGRNRVVRFQPDMWNSSASDY